MAQSAVFTWILLVDRGLVPSLFLGMDGSLVFPRVTCSDGRFQRFLPLDLFWP
jgi:hypothetical protein